MIKSTTTKEFHWNGHDGSLRNNALYKLLFEKPVFSFEYLSILYTDDRNHEPVFVGLDGLVFEHTDAMIAEVEAYIVLHATQDPWAYPAEDSRVMFEEVASLSLIETPVLGKYVPILDWLATSGETSKLEIARAFKKSRVKGSGNEAYELITDETLTNNLNGFIPSVIIPDELQPISQWRFKVKKADKNHVEFDITSALSGIRGHTSYGLLSTNIFNDFSLYGAFSSGSETAFKYGENGDFYSIRAVPVGMQFSYYTLENPSGKPLLEYKKSIGVLKADESLVVGSTPVVSSISGLDTRVSDLEDSLGSGLGPNTYAIDSFVTKTNMNTNLSVYCNENVWYTLKESASSSSASIIVHAEDSPILGKITDSYTVIENVALDSRRNQKVIMKQNGKPDITVYVGLSEILHIIHNGEEFKSYITKVAIPEFGNYELEDAIFMGEQEVFIRELILGGN